MYNINDYEQKYKTHLMYIYNNLGISNDSYIDGDLVDHVYYRLKNLNKYENLNIVLQTGGGNLAAGTRLINILKNSNKKIEFTVLNRCNSTGTYVLLSSDVINITDKSTITPCEPQMMYGNESISTSVIRNIIENYNLDVMNKLDPKIFGEYYATINYFKDICYQVYPKEKADLIINYMLNKVNSHQYPMSINDLNNLNIQVNNLKNTEKLEYLESINDSLLEEFKDINTEGYIESRISLISDCNGTIGYCKKYMKTNNSSKRTFEGYKELDRR